MNLPLVLRTIAYLRPIQVVYQLKVRIFKPSFSFYEAPSGKRGELYTHPIPKYSCCVGSSFTFLNKSQVFSGWNYTGNGMLWAYNQNYFDWINQESISKEEACSWIDKFIIDECFRGNKNFSLDPYPIALRSINWIKFFCIHPECVTKSRESALYSQVKLLERKLEYHLLGNHLLEDAYALYIAAAYFKDDTLQKKASELLSIQLKEQTLSDGAHFEQSPMYHCILLDRLLDCINIKPSDALISIAKKQLGWLRSICFNDGSFPLFNDSVNGISPTPLDIINYAKRLSIDVGSTLLGESGYRKLFNSQLEAIIDVGNIAAAYQPGHSHADTLSYELHIGGRPIVVDSGVSTYEKNQRRQIERGTVAHNCVSPDGQDSYEVWGGFRVGKRCHTEIIEDKQDSIIASHDGFDSNYRRRFSLIDNSFVIEDWYGGEAVSYVHLASPQYIDRVYIEGANRVEAKPWRYSTEYNRFHDGLVLEISFKNYLKYSLS